MEGSESLIKDGVELTPESRRDLIVAYNVLNALLSPCNQDLRMVLGWLDEHVVGNPFFDPERAAALREKVRQYYETDQAPIEGLSADETISLKDAFRHPGILAKKGRLNELFEGIGPVVRATQEAIRKVQQ